MSTLFANTNKVIETFASDVIRLAKIGLGATRTITGRRTKWRGMKPISSVKVKRRGRINTTGTLSKSLESKIKNNKSGVQVDFLMEDYGDLIDKGRKAGNVSKMARIDKWARRKPLKPRVFKNGKMGGFAKDTTQARKAMDFMIRRKIKAFGIEKTEFFQEPFKKKVKSITTPLEDALADDILKQFDNDNKRTT